MQLEAESPEEYRQAVPDHQKEIFEAVRTAIFAAVPEIEEILEYGMLGYPGLANLGIQKNYVSLYVRPKVLAEHKANFPGTSCGKSCLRFNKIEQVDGVRAAAHATWFGGVYQDPKNFFAQIAIEPEEYLPRPSWYAQFIGKRLDDDLRLKRGIKGVTGATLTARATTDAARRLLALHAVAFPEVPEPPQGASAKQVGGSTAR